MTDNESVSSKASGTCVDMIKALKGPDINKWTGVDFTVVEGIVCLKVKYCNLCKCGALAYLHMFRVT